MQSPRLIRKIATLRSSWPALPILIAMMLGQLLGLSALVTVSPTLIAVICVSSIGVFFVPQLPQTLIPLFIATIIGVVLASSSLPPRELPVPNPNSSYLVRVDEDPRFRSPGGIELSLRVEAEINPDRSSQPITYPMPPRYLCRAVHLPWRNILKAEHSSRFIVRATFRPMDRADSGLLSYQGTMLRRGYSGSCKIKLASPPLPSADPPFLSSLRRSIRTKLEQLLGDNERTGLLLSMSLGVRDVVSDPTERAFRRTGLAHLLVLSGYQVTLVFYAITNLVGTLLVRLAQIFPLVSIQRGRITVAACATILFVGIAGYDGASTRALIAALAAMCASLFERSHGLFNSMILALFFMIIIWPGCFLEPGVQLSFAALIGLGLGTTLAGRSRVRQFIYSTTLASLLSSIVGGYWFKSVSIIGFPLNLLAAPLLSLVSVNIAYPCIALTLLGIDPHGWLVGLVARFLEEAKELLVRLSWLKWAAIEWK